MAAAAGLDRVAPVVVEAAPDQHPGTLPVGGRTRLDLPNNHLSCAVTWYGLALTLLGVWIAYHWRRED